MNPLQQNVAAIKAILKSQSMQHPNNWLHPHSFVVRGIPYTVTEDAAFHLTVIQTPQHSIFLGHDGRIGSMNMPTADQVLAITNDVRSGLENLFGSAGSHATSAQAPILSRLPGRLPLP